MNKELYRLYDINEHIGYISLTDKNSLSIDLFPDLDIVSVPIYFWDKYENGEIHFKGEQVYKWLDSIVLSLGRDNILDIMNKHNMKTYNPIEIIKILGKDSLIGESRFELCTNDTQYKKLMGIDNFNVTDKSKYDLKAILCNENLD